MRYFIDSEFIDDGETIDLISIGIVAEDGRELYLQSVAFDPSKASEWVNEHVIAHLVTCPHVMAGRLTRHALQTSGIHPQLLSLTQHEERGQCTFEKVVFNASQGETTGQSHLILGTGSTSHVIGSPFSKLCFVDMLYRPLKNLDAFALGEMRTIGAYADCYWRTRNQMAHEVFTFMNVKEYGTPELWGWCSGYDFVALCQIFGTMMDLPQGWPHYIRDVQYLLDERGITDSELPPVEGTAHNALADAKQIKAIWEMVQSIKQ